MESNTGNTNPATVPQGFIPPPQSTSQATSTLSDNTAAALAYVTIIPAIFFIVAEPYNQNPFISFHAFQSLGFFIVWAACWVLQSVVVMLPMMGLLISVAIGLILFVGWCFTVTKAYHGEWFKLPLIGDFAMSQSRA